MENNTLQHYGIAGMKWGIRRYQNKDGTLTKAGQKRYDKELEKAKAEQKRVKEAEKTKAKLDKLKAMQDDIDARKKALKSDDDDAKAPAKVKPDKAPKKSSKSLKDMTDEELQERITRLQLEERYKALANPNPPASNAKDKRTGREYVKDIFRQIGENTLTNIGTQAANHALGSMINNAFKVDHDDAKKRIVNRQKGQSDKK